MFLFWCDVEGLAPFPVSVEVLSSYIAFMDEQKKSRNTILRAVSTISKWHDLRKADNPTKTEIIRGLLKGISRTTGRKIKQSKPLTFDLLNKMLRGLGSSWPDRRNAAFLCLGWLCALRNSELVALNISDLEVVPEGLIVTIRKSKTDQTGQGYKIGIPQNPLLGAVRRWTGRITTLYDDGPLFPRLDRASDWFPARGKRERITVRGMHSAFRRIADQIGLDSGYSPHSLRAGFITQAAKMGIPERIIQRHSRHASISVLRDYIRDGNIWDENPLPAMISRLF